MEYGSVADYLKYRKMLTDSVAEKYGRKSDKKTDKSTQRKIQIDQPQHASAKKKRRAHTRMVVDIRSSVNNTQSVVAEAQSDHEAGYVSNVFYGDSVSQQESAKSIGKDVLPFDSLLGSRKLKLQNMRQLSSLENRFTIL